MTQGHLDHVVAERHTGVREHPPHGPAGVQHVAAGEDGQHELGPGNVAARSRPFTRRPSPPLEISASRSTRSGNW